jgi:two-component sensor histidine kinase
MERRIVRYVYAASFWTLIGVIFALPSFSNGRGFLHPLLASLAQWWSWGILAPVIVAVDEHLPFTSKQLGRRIIAHVALGAAFTTIFTYLMTLLRALMGIGPWDAMLNAHLLSGAGAMFLWNWLVYLLIVGVQQGFRYYRQYLSGEVRLERLERQFAEARLNALRMQLDPHFLFNTLNTISSQVERDPRLARAMIEHLGDLLRNSLESKDKQEVTLAEELAALNHYLAIQKIRFADQLKVELCVDADVKSACVPCLLLQPLVENSIRHGISSRSSGGTVTVSARRVEKLLEIRVADDGAGLPAGWNQEKSLGIGLSVTQQRIFGLSGSEDTRFLIGNRPNGGTEVEIRMPLKLAGESV